jgi:hypothetical protein
MANERGREEPSEIIMGLAKLPFPFPRNTLILLIP